MPFRQAKDTEAGVDMPHCALHLAPKAYKMSGYRVLFPLYSTLLCRCAPLAFFAVASLGDTPW